MNSIYQNLQILSNDIKDIGGCGYIEKSCKYQSHRNYCRYLLDIPTVPWKWAPWQDLASCDCFRIPV